MKTSSCLDWCLLRGCDAQLYSAVEPQYPALVMRTHAVCGGSPARMRHHSRARAFPSWWCASAAVDAGYRVMRWCDHKLWRQSPDWDRTVKVTADVKAFQYGWRVCAGARVCVFSIAELRHPRHLCSVRWLKFCPRWSAPLPVTWFISIITHTYCKAPTSTFLFIYWCHVTPSHNSQWQVGQQVEMLHSPPPKKKHPLIEVHLSTCKQFKNRHFYQVTTFALIQIHFHSRACKQMVIDHAKESIHRDRRWCSGPWKVILHRQDLYTSTKVVYHVLCLQFHRSESLWHLTHFVFFNTFYDTFAVKPHTEMW